MLPKRVTIKTLYFNTLKSSYIRAMYVKFNLTGQMDSRKDNWKGEKLKKQIDLQEKGSKNIISFQEQ